MPLYGTFKYGEGKYGSAWQLAFNTAVGSYRGHKFTAFLNSSGQTQVHNKATDSNDTVYLRYLEDIAILKFDPVNDHVFVFAPFFDSHQTGSDNSNVFIANVDSAADFYQLRGADFLDGRRVRWSMGFVPFDVSLLNSTSWDDAALADSESGYITISSYPAGSYRAFVYITGTDGTEDASFVITGAISTSGTATVTDVSVSGEYISVDFIAAANDSITYTINNTGTDGTSIALGDLIVFPLSNSKNFPMDFCYQSLKEVHIDELCE